MQLRQKISETMSHNEILKLENRRLKEDNRKVTKHFGQKKTESDDDMSTSLQKVY